MSRINNSRYAFGPMMTSARTKAPKKATRRLSKEQWLELATRLLNDRGPAAMTIESLTTFIGVSTGSFYHHFKSHGRFLDELTDKYIQDYTYVVRDQLVALDLPAREVLIEAVRLIITENFGAMDVHFRALAISYPRLTDRIREADDIRTKVIGSLFKEMGYTGNELRMRVHVFVVVLSMESAVATGLSREDLRKLIKERVKLLID